MLQPGHRSRRRSHRTPSATWGSNRYCGAQRALLRLNLPTARSQPTGPGARAPADWLTRRASSFATSAPGRGGAGPGTTPRPAFAPPRESARGRRRGRRARPKPMTLGPRRRGNPTGAKRGRAVTGRPRGWAPTDNLWGPWETLPLRSSVSQPGGPPPGQQAIVKLGLWTLLRP